MPIKPSVVVKDCFSFPKILMAENVMRIINAVSIAGKGLLLLQNARKKNKHDITKASMAIKYFTLFPENTKNIPGKRNAPITYKIILAATTALSA